MALTILLAEPDAATARSQESALREMRDLSLAVVVYPGADVLDEMERVKPHVLVLRHERGGPAGFAVLARLKKHPDLKSIPVLLTTSDATKDAVERHRASPTRADDYLMLPASRADLLDAIKVLAERAVSHQAQKDAAGGGPLEPPKLRQRSMSSSMLPSWVESVGGITLPKEAFLPPLSEDSPTVEMPPRTSSGGHVVMDETTALDAQLPQPPRAVMAQPDPVDAAWVERLLGAGPPAPFAEGGGAQGFKEPTSYPSNKSPAEPPDARAGFLRDKLKEKERDLQRLAALWRGREQELKTIEARVVEKEAEAESYIAQMNQLTREVQRLQGQLAHKEAEFGSSVNGMITERVMMEKDLIEVVVGKEKEVFALKWERTKLETAAAKMKEQLIGHIYE